MNIDVIEIELHKLLSVAMLAGLQDVVDQIKEAHPNLEPLLVIPATERIEINGEYEDVAFELAFPEEDS